MFKFIFDLPKQHFKLVFQLLACVCGALMGLAIGLIIQFALGTSGALIPGISSFIFGMLAAVPVRTIMKSTDRTSDEFGSETSAQTRAPHE